VRRFLLTSIFVFCIATNSAFATDAKYGYLDMQRAMQTSEAGKEAKEQLAARYTSYQKEINAKQEDLQKLIDEFEKQGMLLSESARYTKDIDIQQRIKELQRFTKDAQDDVLAKDKELTDRIFEGLVKIVQVFCHKNGYTFIFVKNESLVFADDKVDVTDEILKLLDANHKNTGL